MSKPRADMRLAFQGKHAGAPPQRQQMGAPGIGAAIHQDQVIQPLALQIARGLFGAPTACTDQV